MAWISLVGRGLMTFLTGWFAKDVTDVAVDVIGKKQPAGLSIAEKLPIYQTKEFWISAAGAAVGIAVLSYFKMNKTQRKRLLK